MSTEQRPACPVCQQPMVYQPAARSYRCNPCKTTYEQMTARKFPQVPVEVYP